MTKTHFIELETATLFAFAAGAGVLFAMYFHNGPKARTVFNLPVIAPLLSPAPTAEPTPTVSTFSQVSSDGKKEVVMKITSKAKADTSYTFTVANADGSGAQSLYTINLPTNESMSIPFNTFSPDDNYVFLQHNTPTGTEAFVFKADGSPLSTDSSFYNVTQLYNARQTGNTYKTTTGWASETLLIVNTKTPNGDVQSYWFEVPSKAIIPLSTQF